jgi:predicted nucleic acid-binding protein
VSRHFEGAVVFDSEALSRAVARDVRVTDIITMARESLVPVIVSAATVVEATEPGRNRAALVWTVSRLSVEPVTKDLALTALDLLARAGLPGHRHAIDAMVAATALAQPGRGTIYTSDPGDLEALVDGRADVIALR